MIDHLAVRAVRDVEAAFLLPRPFWGALEDRFFPFPLLKTVAHLHQFNVVHNDICLFTVFAAGVLDSGTGPDDILLSGFSEASSDMKKAKSDCYQVFRTVHEFLSQHPEPSRCWTGDALLDDLWHRIPKAAATHGLIPPRKFAVSRTSACHPTCKSPKP